MTLLQHDGLNATFYAFKKTGKWKYEGRGILPLDFTKYQAFRDAVMLANDGKCPGMSTAAEDYYITVIPDPSHETGWPLLLLPIGD